MLTFGLKTINVNSRDFQLLNLVTKLIRKESIHQDKINAIHAAPVPTTVSGLRSCLALVNSSTMPVLSLYTLLQKGVP